MRSSRGPAFCWPAAAALLLAVPAPLRAQSDEETLARYRLTEATLAKFTQVARSIVALTQTDSTLRTEEDEDEAESITELAAMYDRHPSMRRAITGAGMTTREFVTFLLSMFQAAVGTWIVQQPQGSLDKLPPEIPRDNVRFYQQHERELQKLTEEMKALGQAP